MRNKVRKLLSGAVAALVGDGVLPKDTSLEVQVERSRKPGHGDFASNVALVLAGPAGLQPRELAEQLRTRLPASSLVERTEVAGPGFINIFLAADAC